IHLITMQGSTASDTWLPSGERLHPIRLQKRSPQGGTSNGKAAGTLQNAEERRSFRQALQVGPHSVCEERFSASRSMTSAREWSARPPAQAAFALSPHCIFDSLDVLKA